MSAAVSEFRMDEQEATKKHKMDEFGRNCQGQVLGTYIDGQEEFVGTILDLGAIAKQRFGITLKTTFKV